MSTVSILDKMVCVHLAVSIISGRTRLLESDLNLASDEQLPSDLVSLGSKKILDPATLKPFLATKMAAVTYLSKNSLKFLGGYLVPEDKANEVIKNLEAIKSDFMGHKSKFLQNYDKLVQDWIAANPDHKSLLTGAALAKDYVDTHLAFNYYLYTISTKAPMSNIQHLVSNLSDQLLDEIVHAANDIKRQTFTNRDTLSQKSLRPLRGLCDKLKSMAFVNADADYLHAIITGLIDRLPDKGKITGVLGAGLNCLVDTLCDKQKIVLAIERAKNDSTSDAIDDMFTSINTVVPVETSDTKTDVVPEDVPVTILVSNTPTDDTTSVTTNNNTLLPDLGMW